MRFEQYLHEEEYITESINDKGILKSAFFAGTPGCFDGDTLVNTLNGYKKISEIHPGEYVLTFNENTLKDEWNEVETTYEYDINKEMLELEFDNGERVTCTEDHEFYVNGEWIKAKDL